jgi:hypothetical protein
MHTRFKSDILSDDSGCFNIEVFSFNLSMSLWSSFVGMLRDDVVCVSVFLKCKDQFSIEGG